MDFLFTKYGVIFTAFDGIDRVGVKYSKPS